MTWLFDANNGSPGSGGAAFFRLKELLKLAGWTVLSSSDGTTYNGTGDQITTGLSGAGGMNNANAWFRIRQPGTNAREFTFQRSSSLTYSWRVKYSGGPSTGFVGGTPSATETPSATDEVIIKGGGTDASPSFVQMFDTPDAGWRFNAGAQDAAPFSFFWWTHINGATSVRTFGMLDMMEPGSEVPGDDDPAVVYAEEFTSGILAGNMNGFFGTNMKGWIKKNLAGSGFVEIKPGRIVPGSVGFPQGMGQNPYNLKDQFFPWPYLRSSDQAAPFGFKGISSVCRWASVARLGFDTFNVNTTKDFVGATGTTTIQAVLPWNGSDVLL